MEIANQEWKHQLGGQIIYTTTVQLLPTVPVRQQSWCQSDGVHVLETRSFLFCAVSTATIVNCGSCTGEDPARARKVWLKDPVL